MKNYTNFTWRKESFNGKLINDLRERQTVYKLIKKTRILKNNFNILKIN